MHHSKSLVHKCTLQGLFDDRRQGLRSTPRPRQDPHGLGPAPGYYLPAVPKPKGKRDVRVRRLRFATQQNLF
jgi:hypothetical protein